MIPLIFVSLIWAFSFTLIGRYLGNVDSYLVTSVRLGLAALCLLPFLRLGKVTKNNRLELFFIGVVQFGLMYLTYLAAFRFFEAYLVALFSVFTPIWVTVIASLLRGRIPTLAFWAAGLAVLGALVIRAKTIPDETFWPGFLLMQTANLAFAGGQVWFREWKLRHPAIPEKDIFALPCLGGLTLALIGTAVSGIAGWSTYAMPTAREWLVLLYLGIIASGLGFFLWNYGASRVSTGFLAAANNLVIPLAIAVALLFGNTPPAWGRFLAGTTLIFAGLILGKMQAPSRPHPQA